MALVERSVAAFLDELGSAAPTPGGGSAAALAAAAGAALVAMVARLSERDGGAAAAAVRDRADALRQSLTGLIDTDAGAFDAVMAAYRLPRASEEEKARRKGAIQSALVQAAEVPLQVEAHGVAVLQAAADLVGAANRNAVSDLGVAAALAAAGVEGARLNVLINAAAITDGEEAARLRGAAEQRWGAARVLRDQVLPAVEGRMGT